MLLRRRGHPVLLCALTDLQARVSQWTHRTTTWKQNCWSAVSVKLNLPVLLDMELISERGQPADAEKQNCKSQQISRLFSVFITFFSQNRKHSSASKYSNDTTESIFALPSLRRSLSLNEWLWNISSCIRYLQNTPQDELRNSVRKNHNICVAHERTVRKRWAIFLFLAETWGMIWQKEDEICWSMCWDAAANGGWLHSELHHWQIESNIQPHVVSFGYKTGVHDSKTWWFPVSVPVVSVQLQQKVKRLFTLRSYSLKNTGSPTPPTPFFLTPFVLKQDAQPVSNNVNHAEYFLDFYSVHKISQPSYKKLQKKQSREITEMKNSSFLVENVRQISGD